MILIVDSGSTKTRINAVEGENVFLFTLPGINPYYQTEDEIYASLLNLQLDCRSITHVYHYGAGCSFPEKKLIVEQAWSKICRNASVQVDSDMVAAAKALFADGRGIACILGTGANSCFYSNGEIKSNVPPLGFILGDEGSGAFLGSKLVANCMKGIYEKSFVDSFYSTLKTEAQLIMDCVYKQSFPNRYLASFVPFIAENIDKTEMQQLVTDSFRLFFERNVLLYGECNAKVGFVGGVAKQFETQLITVAKEYGYSPLTILKDPIDELIKYHMRKMMTV